MGHSGVGFRLDGSTLGSQSDTLAELVAGGVNKGGIAEVVVPESSAVLEAVLVYACRSDVPAFKLDIPEDEFWLVTSAMAKYEVRTCSPGRCLSQSASRLSGAPASHARRSGSGSPRYRPLSGPFAALKIV